MEYYSAIKNNEFMKFLGKWMELENIILSEVTQSQKHTHGMHSLVSVYYPRSPEAWNIQDTIHRPNEAYEEGRPKYGYLGPSWNGEQNTNGRIYRDKVWNRG